MKYTEEQLAGMSDFEVNKSLAESLKLKCIHERGGKVCFQTEYGGSLMVDYCNNWNDIMPLAVEHKICFIDTVDGGWCAYLFNDTVEFSHKNPQRAIACCLILVLQEKQQ